MPWLLQPQGKSPQYPLDRRLGGPQVSLNMVLKKKNSQSPVGIKNQTYDHPAHSLITILTELSQHLRDKEVA
jgi:hypothetical protein